LPVWEIKIVCRRAQNLWVLEVTDNGSGFTPDGISQLQNKVEHFLSEPSTSLPSLSIGGMGLVNTIVRMKLKYYNNFQYHIRSPLDDSHGTQIVFEIGGMKE